MILCASNHHMVVSVGLVLVMLLRNMQWTGMNGSCINFWLVLMIANMPWFKLIFFHNNHQLLLSVHIMPSFKKNVPGVLLKPKDLRQRRMPIFLLFLRSSDWRHSMTAHIDKTKLFCSHCKRSGHDNAVCFLLHGYPLWWLEKYGKKRGVAASSKSPPFLFPLRLMLLLP